MTAQGLFTMVVNVSSILREVETAGMRLEIGGDFSLYRRLRCQADGSQPYPMFDSASSFVDDTNAFWLCGFNSDRELVHTQAVRLLNLEGTNLTEHLRKHRHKYITPGSTSDPDNTFFSHIPSLDQVTGKVCYHGEFWLKGGEGGHRSQGFTSLLSRVVFDIALKAWSPDYIFGFVPLALGAKGIPIRYGYSRCEPGTWLGANNENTSEEYLVWMSRQDVQNFLETTPHALSHGRRLPRRREVDTSISAVA